MSHDEQTAHERGHDHHPQRRLSDQEKLALAAVREDKRENRNDLGRHAVGLRRAGPALERVERVVGGGQQRQRGEPLGMRDGRGLDLRGAVLATTSTRTMASGMRRRRPTVSSNRPGVAPTLACAVVELEITPQPSEEERAAIAAALAEETEVQPSPWPGGVLPEPDEPFEP